MEIDIFVFELIKNSSINIFLTGKAGTGKTTLLHKVKQGINKNFVVVAPTSVAAINAGGVTMHSFFQIPFGPIIPQEPIDLVSDQELYKYSPEKIRMIRSLELIIIDEIGMVRADQLDHIDHTLRKINLSSQPFGGIQLLLIGDPLQLPPIKENWSILRKYYSSPYFFESMALKKTGFVAVELNKVHRQSNQSFIELLNAVRTGNVTKEMFDVLNERYSADIPATDQRFITITTHHKIVDAINLENLSILPGEVFEYNAIISGNFPTDASPAEQTLKLKVGARVIMTKNDDSGKKAYYNGRAARIFQLSANGITVEFLDDKTQFVLAQQTWHNVKYDLDVQINKVAETNIGSFTQYPVKLAWAITVHKSQGLTFDNVILDIAGSFDSGQAYVALSRCRSLEGLVLRSNVVSENIQTDPVAIRFMNSIHTPTDLVVFLNKNEISEQHDTLNRFFDFTAIADRLHAIVVVAEKSPALLFKLEVIEALSKHIVRPANKFVNDEIEKLGTDNAPGDNISFVNRLFAASSYFTGQISFRLADLCIMAANLPEVNGEVDRLANLLSEAIHLLQGKLVVFEALKENQPLTVAQQRARASHSKEVNRLKENKDQDAPTSHPILYDQLIQWRRGYSAKKSLPPHIILADKTIRRIAEKTPRTLDQLSALPGIGPAKAKEIGQTITDLINAYFGTQQLF